MASHARRRDGQARGHSCNAVARHCHQVGLGLLAATFACGRPAPSKESPAAEAQASALASIRPLPGPAPQVPEPPKVVKVADGFEFLEGPVSLSPSQLLFADVVGNKVYRLDTPSDGVELWRELPGGPSGLAVDAKGSVVAALAKSKRVVELQFDESAVLVPTEAPGRDPLNGPNDIVLDKGGGVYFSDPYYGPNKGAPAQEPVYYVEPGAPATAVIRDLVRPNGLLLNKAQTRLYVSDHAAGELVYYPLLSPGTLGARVDVADGLKRPDGLTRDRWDNVYVATASGVVVFDPRGQRLETIKLPSKASNCAFAGRDGTLYITTKMAIYRTLVRRARKKGAKQEDKPLSKAQLRAAAALFDKRCASCHGDEGRGDGLVAAGFETPPPSFKSAAWQKATTDAAITKSIVLGGEERGGGQMPAFAELKQDPDMLRALTVHIRSFASKGKP